MSTSAAVTKKLLLYFPRCEAEKPIVSQMVKEYDLMVSIFRARVTPEEDGYLVLDVTGTAENIQRAMGWVASLNVTVDEANKGVRLDEARCTGCGNCLSHCPSHALHVPDRRTMRVTFDGELCIECLSCLTVCPFGAVRSVF
jgi:L-aspartate semialdehyde sulfurtransferase ferredoxin